MQMKCLRGLKNKAPRGSYILRVSLLRQPGGCPMQWRHTAQLKTRTHPVRHDGNFYDVGLYFHESLHVVSRSFCPHNTFSVVSPCFLPVHLFIPIDVDLDIQLCVVNRKDFIHSCMHSFSKYLVDTHYAPNMGCAP